MTKYKETVTLEEIGARVGDIVKYDDGSPAIYSITWVPDHKAGIWNCIRTERIKVRPTPQKRRETKSETSSTIWRFPKNSKPASGCKTSSPQSRK